MASPRGSRTRVPVVVIALAITISTTLWAHDFWLVPSAFNVGARSMVEVRGQTSSRFPASESAVTVDRVADARLISKGSAERIADLGIDGKSLRLRHRPRRPGQYVVAVSLKPRSIRESVAGFLHYLEIEGLVTNGSGEVLVRLPASGLWNVRGIHIAPAAPGSGADWDTHWTSVVFHAGPR